MQNTQQHYYVNVIKQIDLLSSYGTGQELAKYLGRVYKTLSQFELIELFSLMSINGAAIHINIGE